jgi:hypothetical protein
MIDGADATLPEIARGYKRHEDEIRRRVHIELYTANREADHATVRVLEERIRSLQESLKWAWRTAAAAAIVVVVNMIAQYVARGPT